MEEKQMTQIQESVEALKARALEKLTNYLAVSAVFLFISFLYFLTDAAWKNAYAIQFLIFFIFIAAYTIRKKLSYKAIAYFYLALGLTLATTDYISIGLSGMGGIFSLFCVMFSLFYLNRKSTSIVALVVITIFCIAAYQYSYLGKLPPNDNLAYTSWLSSWIDQFVAYTAFFLVLGVSTRFLQDQIICLLIELESQKKTIEAQKKQIEYLANYDALTGLPSIRLADEQLDATLKFATQQNHKSALLFLDLDGFKVVNDTYGHEAGDEVLKEVANRASTVIRSGDSIYRIGGDEFLVIVEKVKSSSDLEGLCQRLITAVSTPLRYKNAELIIGVSIGAASYPCSADNSRGLRLKADELMYQVKKSGKNNYRILMDDVLLG